ncbi:6-phosphofructokinase [Pelosinus sp. sgz500959]|uniref:6-phosphofructokinase n=1 Tax=Pelosinus sp. sgz500959 TaxID=3242472 RepID=UPI0036725E63
MLKRIAVMTSGGDSPGMNAAIRAVVRVAIHEGVEVWGIYNGYSGMYEDQMVKLDSRSVGDILQRGGTFLGTARCEHFRTVEGRQKAVDNLKSHGIEGLVVIGGDGSMTGAQLLSEMGIAVIGLPGTIDNDIWGTDYTIGFDTASNTVVDAINKLRDTASSHGRVIVLEVMGRNSGWIAMTAGLAGGAEHILIPEMSVNLDEICEELTHSHASGKKYSVVVVAEGAGSAVEIGKKIVAVTGLDTRVSVLGHIQRGGSPSVFDRILASTLGEHAVLALIAGLSNVMFGFRNGGVVTIDLADAIRHKRTIDPSMFRLANLLAK